MKKELVQSVEAIITILKMNMMIVCSWGIHDVVFSNKEQWVEFSVNGFKFQGRVRVRYNEGMDCFDVDYISVKDNKREVVKTTEGLYIDNLISSIDNEVEMCENYKERVENEYKIS